MTKVSPFQHILDTRKLPKWLETDNRKVVHAVSELIASVRGIGRPDEELQNLLRQQNVRHFHEFEIFEKKKKRLKYLTC